MLWLANKKGRDDMSLKELKQYLRVDYTDDDSMIELMHDAVIDEMKELIPSFDPEKPTNRQKILICSYVKELYDHRDRMYNNGKITSDSTERIRYAIQSMMLKETLRDSMATARIKFYKRNKSLENGRQQEKEPTLFYEAWCEIRNLYGQELYEALDVRLENAIVFEVRYCRRIKEIKSTCKRFLDRI